MNGYSVEEAAEVLGVPQGRVWELLARGVLAGANEGGASMRVYLKGAIPAPAAISAPVTGHAPDEASNGNGNENGHSANGNHGELSPFRELLTEFRNLTERYGQALLALGEARGEVASLRSRVDLLEARMDMRLPMRATSTVAWELPDRQPEPAEAPMEPPAPEMPTEAALAAAETPPATHGGRSRRSDTDTRAAVAGLADALARAEDPTLSALPGAQEAAEALAALQQQAEAAEPEEPVFDVDEFAAADESIVMAAELDGLAAAAPAIDRFEEGIAEASEVAAEELVVAPAPNAFDEPASDEVAEWTEPEAVVHDVPAEDLASRPIPAEPLEAADEPALPADEAPDSPYTTDVIEPDWFADGDFAWLQPPAPDDEPTPDAVPIIEPAATVETEPDNAGDEPSEVLPAASPDGEGTPDVESWTAVTEQPSTSEPTEEPVTEEIQEAFEDAGPPRDEASAIELEATIEPEPDNAGDEPSEVLPAASPDGERTPDVESWTAVTEQPSTTEPIDEPVAEEIQEAFEDAGPPRAEAIAIEPDEPDASPGHDVPGASEPRAEAEGRVSSFGLYRGQPEGPIEAARSAQAAMAVRDEEAVMWLGDEFEAGDIELATPGWRDGSAAPSAARDEPPPLQLSDAEIEQLASSEGWDKEEVAAIRGLLGRGEPVTEAEPEPPREPQGPTINAVDRPRTEPAERRAIPIGPAGPEQRPADWLQGRRGPAASAYRRLRRILQG